MKAEETTKIEIPFPDDDVLQLKISVGACHLKISPGAEAGNWVTGTYTDPTGSVPNKITNESGEVKISQKQGIGTLKTAFAGAPTMSLSLGQAKPYALTIESGASDSVIDLGGLPLSSLTIKEGAGSAEIDFSAPNPEEMEKLSINAGAVTLTIRNLANANFAAMTLDGGAATYEFDFGGELRRSAMVKLNAGASTMKLNLPTVTATRVTAESLLGNLDIGDGFFKKEGAFWNEAALTGKEPALDITAKVTLGTLGLVVGN
jgi:hypothetical protein